MSLDSIASTAFNTFLKRPPLSPLQKAQAASLLNFTQRLGMLLNYPSPLGQFKLTSSFSHIVMRQLPSLLCRLASIVKTHFTNSSDGV